MKKWFKECPFCANEIKEKAIKCQYCWEFLPEEKKEEPKKKVKKERKDCPFCSNKVDIDAKICPFCDERLDNNDINNKSEVWWRGQINLKATTSEINSCIKNERKWQNWARGSIVWIIFYGIVLFSWPTLNEKEKAEKLLWIAIIVFIITIIYFFIWLIKNYRILLNSNIKWLTSSPKSWIVFSWICPIVNLYMPQRTLEDVFECMLSNVWENYDKNLLKIRWIFWIISLVSSCLMYCYPVWLSMLAIISFLISTIAHIYLLLRICNKIISAQEKYLKKTN